MPTRRECYLCSAPATNDEHLPPKAFFPKAKDLPAYGNLRKRLVTVPACSKHNDVFATDDEYVAIAVALSPRAGQLGGDQFWSKWARAMMRRGARLKKDFERDMSFVPVLIGGTRLTFCVNWRLDRIRYESVMERVARGLYFHETGDRLESTVRVETPTLEPITMLPVFPPSLRGDLSANPCRVVGDERVFTYRLRAEPFLLHMSYYGGFDVYAASDDAE